VVLAAQLGPTGLPAFAGFAHAAYHLLSTDRVSPHGIADHDAAEHAAAGFATHTHDEHGRHATSAPPVSEADVVVHSHGPDGAPHSHTPVVDRAIVLAGEGGDTAMGPTSSSQQVDRHIPPAMSQLAGAPRVTSLDFDAAPRLTAQLTSAPLVPPPRG
jgi:hypothetical protein